MSQQFQDEMKKWKRRAEARFDEGDRVELVRTTDDHTDLSPGDRGTVDMIDAAGTVFVDWDNGSTLGMVLEEDEIKTVDPESEADTEDTDEGTNLSP